MVSDDIMFLLIFIVLPTALIVSGFWLALLVRREARFRAAARMNLTSGQIAGTDEPPESEISDLQIPLPIGEPAYELSPVVADLLYSDDPPPPPIITDERLLELLDEQDRDPMREVITAKPDTETVPYDRFEWTEEIESVEADVAESTGDEAERSNAEPAGAANEEAGESRRSAVGEVEAAVTGYSEHHTEASDVDVEGDDGPDSRRRRQPASRLVPSTENVRRRGRTAGRRVPKIPRSSSRDEDAMERENGI